MSATHKPQRGDRVNDKRRNPPYQNGFVHRILYDDGPNEVVVKYDDELVFYDYSEFEYSWADNRLTAAFVLT